MCSGITTGEKAVGGWAGGGRGTIRAEGGEESVKVKCEERRVRSGKVLVC